MALTRRQREVLSVIEQFIDANGYSPSLEEIGGSLGLSSVANRSQARHAPRRKGARAPRVEPEPLHRSRREENGKAFDLPLVGRLPQACRSKRCRRRKR
jgi:SOS-response transcriptional repressor LexA